MGTIVVYRDGQIVDTIQTPDAPKARSGLASFAGVVRAKAKILIKAGKHAEALTLLKTIGE